jgi:hypothetical protein
MADIPVTVELPRSIGTLSGCMWFIADRILSFEFIIYFTANLIFFDSFKDINDLAISDIYFISPFCNLCETPGVLCV